MPKAKSKAQARYFGLIAGGGKPRGGGGPSRAHARAALRGVKVKRLPSKKGRRR